MSPEQITRKLAKGRTEYIIPFCHLEDWQERLHQGSVKPLQWLVYYNDLTALKYVLQRGGNFSSIDLDSELGNAAFFGHWKICELFIQMGANVNARVDKTNETPLHNALVKAGRPYYLYTVKILLQHGADPNAKTIPGLATGAFMRDVRTRGETPLHRAAAYADAAIIHCLLDHGADRTMKDASGASPLTWASEHLRPGVILSALAFGDHRIGEAHKEKNTSDHGLGWGNSMDWNLFGDYEPENE
ncbi:MAG: ankyrin repeat domain-containing protein [Saprospiraceae bacterium]|nr:ankyrin repeat domain-containing protein [Saprospiraceae bacterium]